MRHSKTVATMIIVFLVSIGSYAGHGASAITKPTGQESVGHPGMNKPTSNSTGGSRASVGSTGRISSSASAAPIVTVTRIRSQIHVAITWSNGLGITLDAVFNPARPARKFSALPGEPRLVAIKFTLRNAGKKAIAGDILQEASAVGAEFQLYPGRPVRQLSECGGFNAGRYVLRPGSSATGCATFAVPLGVAITKVLVAPDGPRAKRGLWDLT